MLLKVLGMMSLNKICSRCKLNLPVCAFYPRRNRASKYQSQCKSCEKKYHKNYTKRDNPSRSSEARKAYRRNNPSVMLFTNAKLRAKQKGWEFNIDRSDLVVPKLCPVLGIELIPGAGCSSPNSPTVDRLDNTKGYIKGNVAVISRRANHLKNDSNLAELKKIVAWWESLL